MNPRMLFAALIGGALLSASEPNPFNQIDPRKSKKLKEKPRDDLRKASAQAKRERKALKRLRER